MPPGPERPREPGRDRRPERPEHPDDAGRKHRPEPAGWEGRPGHSARPVEPERRVEERFGALILEGQRCELWIRSEPDGAGTWHNAVLFRRDGKLGPVETIAGMEWHVPPDVALQRARALPEKDRIELFQRGLRPPPPLA